MEYAQKESNYSRLTLTHMPDLSKMTNNQTIGLSTVDQQHVHRSPSNYGRVVLYQIKKTYFIFTDNPDKREKQFELLRNAIKANQLTTDICENVFDAIDSLKRNEMKVIAKIIVRELKYPNKQHRKIDPDCQKHRCEQTLALIDRLPIFNDSIWLYWYQKVIYWCFEKQKFHIDSTMRKNNQIWIKLKSKYVEMIHLPFFTQQKNAADRMRIVCDFAYLLRKYDELVDTESIKTVRQWVADVKTMEKSVLNKEEWNKTNSLIEKCEINLKLFELHLSWQDMPSEQMRLEQQQLFCEQEMEKLKNAAAAAIQLSCADMRDILEAFRLRIRKFVPSQLEKIEYAIELLDLMDRIECQTEPSWQLRYETIVNDCYYKLNQLTTDLAKQEQITDWAKRKQITDWAKRKQIADRMHKKFRQLIEISNVIYLNQLNHPFRIVIIDNFSELALLKYRREIGNACIVELRLITKIAREQEQGSLTDFEFEDTDWALDAIEYRLATFK